MQSMDILVEHLASELAVTSTAVCIACTPLLHVCGVLWYGLPLSPRPKSLQHGTARTQPSSKFPLELLRAIWFFPLTGGKRCAAFQVLGWALWTASGLAGLHLFVSMNTFLPVHLKQLPLVPPSHVPVVSGATAVSSLTALLFIVKAMLVYERPSKSSANWHPSHAAQQQYKAVMPPQQYCSADNAVYTHHGSTGGMSTTSIMTIPVLRPATLTRLRDRLAVSKLGQVLCCYGPPAVVLVMGLLLSVTGVLLLMSVETLPDMPSRLVYCCLSLVCLIIGASSTHGLGGYLQWGRKHTTLVWQAGVSLTVTSTGHRRKASKDLIWDNAGAAYKEDVRVLQTERLISTGSVTVTRRLRRVTSEEADLGCGEEGSLLVLAPVEITAQSAFTADQRGSTFDFDDSAQDRALRDLDLDIALRHTMSEGAASRCASMTLKDEDVAKHIDAARRVSSSTAITPGSQATTLPAPTSVYEDAVGEAWAFFQPFAGGTVFVITQAVGWSLFAVTCVLVISLAKMLVQGVASCVRCWILGAGVTMMTSQVVLGVSVWTWRNSKAARQLVQPIISAGGRTLRKHLSFGGAIAPPPETVKPLPAVTEKAPRKPAKAALFMARLKRDWKEGGVRKVCRTTLHTVRSAVHYSLAIHVPIVIMYIPMQTFFSLWAVTFVFMPNQYFLWAWLGLLTLGYALSLIGEPQHTGKRTWPAFRDWISECLEPSLKWWFGGVTVVTAWDESQGHAPPPADGKYIFGFHPHGLYPTGAGFLPMLPSFKRQLPGIRPITLTASVLYYLPAIKDLSLWLGFRQVSRRTFKRAIADCGSVIICPGGQAELVYAFTSHAQERSFTFVNGTIREVQRVEAAEAGVEAAAGRECAQPPASPSTHQAPGAQSEEITFRGEDIGKHVTTKEGQGRDHGNDNDDDNHEQSQLNGGTAALSSTTAVAAAGRGTDMTACESSANVRYCSDVDQRVGWSDCDTQIHRGVVVSPEKHCDDKFCSLEGCGVMQDTTQQRQQQDEHDCVDSKCGEHSGCVDHGNQHCHDSKRESDDTHPRQVLLTSTEAGNRGHSRPTAGDGFAASQPQSTLQTRKAPLQQQQQEGECSSCGSKPGVAATPAPTPHLSASNTETQQQQGLRAFLRRMYSHLFPSHATAGEMVIYSGHKGFIRLAIETQAAVMPVLALGEVLQLRNLIHWPSMQKWTYKRFGFPLPWFAVGRWAVSPLPFRTPLVYVIGHPIQPPKWDGIGAVPQELVDQLHAQFYASLEEMYVKHAHKHPAFKATPLTMLSGHTAGF